MRQAIRTTIGILATLAWLAVGPAVGAPAGTATDDQAETRALEMARARRWEPIDLIGFDDSVRHYRSIAPDLDYPRYRPEQIVAIAENLLLYQMPNGGWPKNIDWLKVVTPEQARQEAADESSRRGATLDNRNIYTQCEYLARVYNATRLERYKAASRRTIDYLLREQRPSGGWRGADVEAITFNDDVMSGVLQTLRRVATGAEPFGWVDAERRKKAQAAIDKGIACILKCQIRRDGQLTGWCQQHSHDDFRPVKARTYELPSICSMESVGVVEFLMGIDHPSPQVIEAIQGAVAWLDSVKLHGLRLKKEPIKPWRFEGRRVDQDVTAVADPNASPIWARYYDLEKNKPLFVRRGGQIVPSFSDLQQERRVGYQWYGYWPATLLDKEYPAWQKKWSPGKNVLKDSTPDARPQ
jgi:PelA/Pel-15E family pectate lyase